MIDHFVWAFSLNICLNEGIVSFIGKLVYYTVSTGGLNMCLIGLDLPVI